MDSPPYSTVAHMMPLNVNDVLFKKLDSIVAKVEEESSAKGQSLVELQEELRNRYEETKQHVNMLENKVVTMENKFEDLSLPMDTLMQNI
jgi:formate-dependent phosphoribosylglycinamide formyltransferase (GAR transformylase)